MIGLLLASILLVLPGAALAWEVDIDGTLGASDEATSVVVDAAGDIIAAGKLTNAETGTHFAVIKLSGVTGMELWRQELHGTGGCCNEAHGLALGPGGNVVAVGKLANVGSGEDFTAVKLSGSTGALEWGFTIDGGANLNEVARAAAVGQAGNVIVTGSLSNATTGADLSVLKLSGASGALIWRTDLDGTDNSNDMGNAVELGIQGNVVVAGGLRNMGSLLDFGVVKLDEPSGTEIWRRTLTGPLSALFTGPDEALAIAVNTVGEVHAAGYLWQQDILSPDSFEDFMVVKLGSINGGEMWRKTINGTLNGNDRALAIALDNVEDVIVGGRLINSGTNADFTVVKYFRAIGTELWRQEIDGTLSGDDEARSLVADSSGDVIAAGVLANSGVFRDFVVIKFDGDTGEELWRREINGAAVASDEANAVALDGSDDVVAVGWRRNENLSSDFSVIKLGALGGCDFPICGDVDRSGVIDPNDVTAYRFFLADPNGSPLSESGQERCTVIGEARPCDVRDLPVLRRTLENPLLLPGIAPMCEAVLSLGAVCPDESPPQAECSDTAECFEISPTLFCQKDGGDCEGQGVCDSRPASCGSEADLVCGCNEITYLNPCQAARAGMSIFFFGPCS